MNWMMLPYKRYFEFRGRSQRREFWLFSLFCFGVSLAVMAVFGSPYGAWNGTSFAGGTQLGATGSLLRGAFGLFNLIPSLAVGVRRLHDIDRSGWWLLLYFVPIVGWLILLVFFCLDGTFGSNRYGYDPKGRGTASIFS